MHLKQFHSVQLYNSGDKVTLLTLTAQQKRNKKLQQKRRIKTPKQISDNNADNNAW